ncbi:hypothetical protein KC19_1G036800 [Ceratodon purpureus]|uniref:Uncharacterized protein n=1 Tax=Ceratodon purpureus TaxID=3225 RepID=A0A8T0J448_CERPU|nr:hypothetical protein KC19_1G036800 [Ceratodon purpureus]
MFACFFARIGSLGLLLLWRLMIPMALITRRVAELVGTIYIYVLFMHDMGGAFDMGRHRSCSCSCSGSVTTNFTLPAAKWPLPPAFHTVCFLCCFRNGSTTHEMTFF